jgi:molybdopterin/thiamine biosynthesis adenylyltransferase
VRAWFERFPDTYADQRRFWLDKGFDEVDVRRDGVAFTGVISVRVGGADGIKRHDFKLKITYPPGYPYVAPRVEFIDPPIKRARHQGVDGAPCLFPPSAWTTNFPASELHVAIERWLAYHVSGHFPRELAIYELPAYFGLESFSVLATPTAMECMNGGQSGRFSVDELVGYALGVLWTVDQQSVGKVLVDALAPGKTAKLQRHSGRWYRLNEEPRPMKNTTELQRLLVRAGHRVDLRPRPSDKRELIGLVFPDAALGDERLLMLDIGVASKTARADVVKGWPMRAPELYLVSHKELFRRLEGVRDINALDAATIACFGLGAIGSPLVGALAREGVGDFILCDPDRLRPGNVTRHALDLRSVGKFKAEAVEGQLSCINPWVVTRPETENLSHPDVLATLVSSADLVVGAIGDDLQEELLGEAIYSSDNRPPMILARTLHGGAAFRVALIRPGIDACIACLAAYRAAGDPQWISVPPTGLPDIYDTGCAAPARPGAGLTSQHAAIFAAARALDVLDGSAGETNHWLWVERAVPAADPRLAEPRVLHTATFLPVPACEICGA